jgi:hypothetical protein
VGNPEAISTQLNVLTHETRVHAGEANGNKLVFNVDSITEEDHTSSSTDAAGRICRADKTIVNTAITTPCNGSVRLRDQSL